MRTTGVSCAIALSIFAACGGSSGAGADPAVGLDGGSPEASSSDGGGDTDGGMKDGSVLDSGSDARVPCPAGLGATWTCDAPSTHRVRCVDAFIESIACENGCAAVSGAESVCSCGASSTFTRWNCTADGNLHACPGGALIDESCEGRGCAVGPVGVSDTCHSSPASTLQATLDLLGPQCGTLSAGSTCGIAVRDLVTREFGDYRGNAFYVSASSVKAVWVAAALYDTTIAAVTPFADPVFRNSDNTAAGQVIDLLASPARVNTFMWDDVQIPDSGFCHWNFDHARDATNCPDVMSGDNFFTADDMVRFLGALWDRTLLGEAKSSQELEWMTLSPRSGPTYGGWLGTRIPAAARATMHHKAGWLQPDAVPGYSNSNEIGIIEVPGGHAYAVSILMSGAPTQAAYDAAQLPALEKISCVVYHAVARDAGDPIAACP